MQSLSTAVSGLSAFSQEISVISNNVANSETDSYKSSDVSFADLLSSSLSGASGTSTGAGVTVGEVSQTWTEGDIISTDISTDLAINGSGFFIVNDESTGETYYTRNGGFSFDDDGTLIISDTDYDVQGYAIDDNGNLGSLGDITVSYDASPASATTEISTTANLDADAETGDTYDTPITVYDSLGNEHSLTITYTKTADNTWTYAVSSDESGLTVTVTNGDDDTDTTTNTLNFGTSGALQSTTSGDPVITVTGISGADDMTISWDLYDEGTTTTSGTTTTTTYLSNSSISQYGLDSALYDSDQDGYASGSLSSIAISDSGVVTATYSNGTTKDLFQIALADFNNYDGLIASSGGLYSSSTESGDPIIGVPGSGRFGDIETESLESSNVDLSSELANLITAQRAYQACSKVFTASDELLQTLINM